MFTLVTVVGCHCGFGLTREPVQLSLGFIRVTVLPGDFIEDVSSTLTQNVRSLERSAAELDDRRPDRFEGMQLPLWVEA